MTETTTPVEEQSSAVQPGDLTAKLAECREKAGLDLEQAADEMHLSANLLRSLEKEDFPRLPEPPYVRGYLRGYAKLASVDAKDLIRIYEALRGADPDEIAHHFAPARSLSRVAQPSVSPVVIKLVLLAALAIGIGMVVMSSGVQEWASNTWASFSAQTAPPQVVRPAPALETFAAQKDAEEKVVAEQQTAAASNAAATTPAAPAAASATDSAATTTAPATPTASTTADTATPTASPAAPATDTAAATTTTTATPDNKEAKGTETASSTTPATVTPPAAAATASSTADKATATDTTTVTPAATPATATTPPATATAPTTAPAAATTTDGTTATPPATAADGTTPATPTDAAATPVKPIGGEVNVKLEFADDVWMQVKDDGKKTVFESLNSKGTTKEFKATTPLNFKVGNAPGVKVYLNGQLYDQAPYIKGSVARFKVE